MKIVITLFLIFSAFISAAPVCYQNVQSDVSNPAEWVESRPGACSTECPCAFCWIEFERLSAGFSTADFNFRAGIVQKEPLAPMGNWGYSWSSGGWSSSQASPSVTASYGSYTISLTMSDGVHQPVSCSAVLVNPGLLSLSCPGGALYGTPQTCGCYAPSDSAGKQCLTAAGISWFWGTFVCQNNQIYCVN